MTNSEAFRNTDDITESIRTDIVHGVLPAGSEIVLADLSEILGATMSDVRQGLLRLADQNLVEALPDGSFQVVSTSAQDLRELTAMRQILEGEAVRISVQRNEEAWIARVQSAFDGLVSAGQGVDVPGLDVGWRVAHTAFHEALCAGCDNRRLLAEVRSLRDEAEIYRELSAAAMTDERRKTVDRQHLALLELALAGHADEAAATLRSHLEGTMRSVADSAVGQGES